MTAELEKGYDVVSGWRRNRKDPWTTRTFPSICANRLISWFSGLRLHDYVCALKVYRREALEGVRLYGEMHRFIPLYAAWRGAKVTEMEVHHRPRSYGRSKYGFSRAVKAMLDLLTVKFLVTYSSKPIYIFGGAGLVCLAFGIVTGVIVVFRALVLHRVQATPMIFFMTIFILASIQFLLMGLLAEVGIRTYHESQNKPSYVVKRTEKRELD